ncbi:MAG: pilus assembly protein PilM, partial [Limisphaerales bacterium]
RSINIGANAITQDFASESNLDWDEAERLKIEEGFVSLGGAYEEPDNPNQALISKIARQVMTRLHIQMNQTFQFYRGQQGGSPPEKLYLAGGASLLPYTAQFFAEKLNIPVDYFNPFRNVQIDEEINLEDIAKAAHTFGEVVGLGIRNLAQCPVDLNLMPASYLKLQRLNAKRTYFVASVLAIVMTISSFGLYSNWIAAEAAEVHQKLQQSFDPLGQDQKRLLAAQGRLSAAQNNAGRYGVLFDSKTRWMNVLLEIQQIMLAAQTNHGVSVDPSAASQPVLARVWIEKLKASVEANLSDNVFDNPDDGGADGDGDPGGNEEQIGIIRVAPAVGTPLPSAGTQKVSYLNLNCRALNLVGLSPSANTEFCYALQDAFRSSDLFSSQQNETGLHGQLHLVSPTNGTFGFQLVLKLNEPLVVN